MNINIEKISSTPTINLAIDTINLGKQALIFAGTKVSAEKTAEDIAKKLTTTEELEKLAEQALILNPPTKQCIKLNETLKKGIAFHHSGLTSKQRNIVEKNFKEGKIKIICCTPTLAAGVDLPAYRAIIKTTGRYGRGGYQKIPVLEYLQMAGRAGRPKYDKEGQAILIAKNEKDREELYELYVKGEPEKIFSKLAVEPALRTHILSLISTNFAKSTEELMEFFSKTFWAHQYENIQEIQTIINSILNDLELWGFIQKAKQDDFLPANETASQLLKPTKLGMRISELYIDPLTANQLITSIKQTENPFLLLQAITNCLEMRPLPTIKKAEEDKIELIAQENTQKFLTKEPQYYDLDYDDFLKTIKTAKIIENWIDEATEEKILFTYGIRPGELKSKLERADWLTYSWGEIAKTLNKKEFLKQIIKLRVRIKNGVKEELLPLLKLKNIGRVRARKLHDNKIKTIRDVKKVDITTLSQILGNKIAEDVKKQVTPETKNSNQKLSS